MPAVSDNTDTIQRRKRQAIIREKIKDVLATEGDMAIIDMLNLAISLWAERYPANLSDGDKQKVSKNFVGATPSLIAERSMSEEGLQMAMIALTQMSSIVIDYRPESFCRDLVEEDMNQEAVGSALTSALNTAFGTATSAGFSAFGAMSTMIMLGVVFGTQRGLPWALIARPLLDALSHAIKMGTQPTAQELKQAEERAIQMIMLQLNISRAAAKRYVDYAKTHGD